jgi:BirA family transcriptional regulator, biotin operon repressor / biotin---[acetyl-CoA-carboxylase] ligase
VTIAGAEEPAGLWQGESAATLATLWGAPEVRCFRRVGSTNDLARRLAIEGAPAGTVVVADEQVAGRGRAGRVWRSPAGLGLWLSLVARPAALPEPAALPLLVGLEAARALDGFVSRDAVQVKWPNDLLLHGRKIGGILCEAVWAGDAPAFVVVGIGINVLHGPEDFPEELRHRATSVRMGAERAPSILDVATALVPRVDAITRRPGALDGYALDEMRRRDALLGRELTVTNPATGAVVAHGRGAGIGADGALLLDDETGTIRPIRSGTVRDRNDDPTDE